MKKETIKFKDYPLVFKAGFTTTMGLLALHCVCCATNRPETNDKCRMIQDVFFGMHLLAPIAGAFYLAGRIAAKSEKKTTEIHPVKLTDHSNGEKLPNPKYIKIICRG